MATANTTPAPAAAEQNNTPATPPAPATAVAVAPKGHTIDSLVGFTPETFNDAWRLAKVIAASDLAPKGFIDKPANCLIAIQMGAELGLNPMAAIQNIAVINGRPCLWGDSALAVVMNHKEYEWHKEYQEGKGDERVAVCEIKREGHELYTVRFTVAMAKQAKLWTKEGPWINYPDRMLQMRARSWAVRDKFPDALRGMGVAEEVRDIPTTRVVQVDDLPDDVQRKSLAEGEGESPKDPSPEAAAATVDESSKQPPISSTSSDEPATDVTESTEQEQREQARALQAVVEQERIARDVKPVDAKQTELLPEDAVERLKSDIEQGLPMNFDDRPRGGKRR